MASEYSVNIKLNTQQVKKDLKTIGKEIENVGRKATGSKKRILTTDADDQLLRDLGIKTRKFARTINPILNKADKVASKGGMLALPDTKMLNAQVKGIKRLETSADISAKHAERKARAEERSAKFAVESMKANQASAKAGAAHARRLERMTGDTGFTAAQYGPQFASSTLPTSMGLNFDPRTGKLLRGPAGSSRKTAANLRRRFDTQSALISGGFPLLFGQGPITAAAGAVGGGVGGMFGQMGGFAGGIAATAAVQSISSALNAVSELGRALSKPTENIQTLVDKLALANTPTGDLALKLEKLGLTSSAASVLIEKFAEDFGRTPIEVEKMTKELDEFNREMAKFGLRLQFIVADVFGPMVTLINKLPLGTIAKFFTARGFDFLNPGGATMPNVMTLPQKKLKVERQRGSGIQNNLPSTLQDVSAVADQLTFNREIKPLKQALEIEKLRLTTSSEELNIMKEEFELENLTNELKIAQAENEKVSTDELTTKISKLTAQVDLQKQVVANAKALEDPFRKLSNIISMDIGNGIKGLIRGTSTLGDLLNNVLNKLSDAFLNLAIFGNFGGGSVTGGLLGMFGFANGGRPPVGRPSVVGERGPELFVPDRAGTIVPNHELGGMGGTNIVVNVDASGSNVEGDEEEGRQLGIALSAAIESELIKQKRPGGLLA